MNICAFVGVLVK